MSEKLKVGDVVQLKSGGPKMTVTNVLEKVVHTSWFAGSKNEKAIFPFDAVAAFQEEPKK
jgi:uncharacterized protein YodC (DUF2158 family)